MIRIFVFGHPDNSMDSVALQVAEKFKNEIDIEFVKIFPNNDLPAVDPLYIMDVVDGITKVTIIDESNADQIIPPPRGSVHDFDLGFQLKYMLKIGKIKTFKIIGLPMNTPINYERVKTVLAKLI